MEPFHERIEDFMQRYGRVLVVVVAILLALLVLRRLRGLASLVRIGALLWAVVLVAMAVTSVGLLQAPTYEASAKMLVGWKQGGYWANLSGSGEEMQTLEYREVAPTFILAIDSRPVAEETIRRLELEMTPAELLYNLTVEQVEITNFIVLTYKSNDPVEATKIVNTVGKVVAEIASHRRSDVTAKVWEKATVPESPVGPHPWRNGLLTLVVGWTLTGLVVLVHRSS